MPVDQDAEGVPITGEHPVDERAVVLAHDPRHLIVIGTERMVAGGEKRISRRPRPWSGSTELTSGRYGA
jgi:hypothetical protein